MEESTYKENVPPFSGITCDSREVKPGYAFVAIRGFKQDGNNYIDEAIDRGASVIFTEKPLKQKNKVPIIQVKDTRSLLGKLAADFYNYPSEQLKVIGVTGTNGKTTTTHLIYHLLNYKQKQAGLIGTVRVDNGKNVEPGGLTTPPPVKLQRYLKTMLDNNLKYACMEVSSHGIKLKRIAGTNFRVKVGTNITTDHYDLHPDFNDYLQAKKSFLKQEKNELVLINGNDNYLKNMGKLSRKQLYFAINNRADIEARNIRRYKYGSQFEYILRKEIKNEENELIKPCRFNVKMHLPGEHNIYNSLVAITIALYYGIEIDIIKNFFAEFNGVWRRLQIIYDEDFTIIDDCAHNPGSYEAVFKAISTMNYSRILIVNSLRGNRGIEINKKNAETISRWLPQLKNYILFTSNCEDVVKPIDKVYPEEEEIFLKTLKNKDITYTHYQKLETALRKTVADAQDGDLVLLLGPHAMDGAADMILSML